MNFVPPPPQSLLNDGKYFCFVGNWGLLFMGKRDVLQSQSLEMLRCIILQGGEWHMKLLSSEGRNQTKSFLHEAFALFSFLPVLILEFVIFYKIFIYGLTAKFAFFC